MDEQAAALSGRSVHGRYLELDALRGVAAAIVLGNHLGSMFNYKPPFILLPLFDGREAVILFFVLSGFVLSIPFWNKGRNGAYGPYLIRRFFRIYIPFAAAAVVAILAARCFLYSHLPLGDWFRHTWQTALTPSFLLSEFLMAPDGRLNTAFWSLRYEVQLSIAFPLILRLIRKVGSSAAVILAVLLHLAARVAMWKGVPDPHWWLETAEFGSMFIIGATLARHREALESRWHTASSTSRVCCGALASVLFFYGDPLLWHLYRQDKVFGELTMCLGACGLILIAIFSVRLRRLLRMRAAELLGRLSFSLYLVHGTVLFSLVNLMYYSSPRSVLIGAMILASFTLSYVFCIVVEEPALRLGKRLASARIRQPQQPIRSI